MIIDKQGRIGGKLNIIDVCVALALVIAVIVVAARFFSPRSILGTGTETFVIKYYAEEAPVFACDAVFIGGRVEDEQKNIDMGVITDIQTEPGYMYVPDAQGQLHRAHKEGYYSIEITSEVQATPFEQGILLFGNKYSVGHSMTIRAGTGKIYLRISGIERKA